MHTPPSTSLPANIKSSTWPVTSPLSLPPLYRTKQHGSHTHCWNSSDNQNSLTVKNHSKGASKTSDGVFWDSHRLANVRGWHHKCLAGVFSALEESSAFFNWPHGTYGRPLEPGTTAWMTDSWSVRLCAGAHTSGPGNPKSHSALLPSFQKTFRPASTSAPISFAWPLALWVEGLVELLAARNFFTSSPFACLNFWSSSVERHHKAFKVVDHVLLASLRLRELDLNLHAGPQYDPEACRLCSADPGIFQELLLAVACLPLRRFKGRAIS